VGDAIMAEGWGQVLFSENLAESDVSISAVFYRDAADEAAARGLAEKRGGVSTYLTEDYAEFDARLIVLIGADYAGPGAEGGAPEPAPETGEGEASIDDTAAAEGVPDATVDPALPEPEQPIE